jgi:hypothetical protein
LGVEIEGAGGVAAEGHVNVVDVAVWVALVEGIDGVGAGHLEVGAGLGVEVEGAGGVAAEGHVNVVDVTVWVALVGVVVEGIDGVGERHAN